VKTVAALLLALAAVPAWSQSAPSAPSDFAARAAKEAGATVLPSGLVYRATVPGTGASPAATDVVRVHYRGVLADGKEFDSSHKRGQPAEFPLNRVIACWTEGVQRMKVGGKAVLTCPPSIAYGSRGAAGVIPPDATLQFEIELLGVVR
jgi:FKBP-type peptidyl-prolyl cis-trans isomerase FkpA